MSNEQGILCSSNKFKNNNNLQKKNKLPYDLRKMYVSEIQCPDCKKYGKVIEDIREGKSVCTKCGLVIGDQILAYDAPNTFNANTSNPNKFDSSKYQFAVNSYLSDMYGVSTDIGTMQTNKENVW